MEKQIPQQKRVDVTEIRYIHPIWFRERDLSAFFAAGKKYRLRRHGSRRPTVRRTVGTDLSNPSLILLIKQKHRRLAVFLFHGQAVNNALEQAHFKNVAKPMFSGRKRTGFS